MDKNVGVTHWHELDMSREIVVNPIGSPVGPVLSKGEECTEYETLNNTGRGRSNSDDESY